MEARKKMSRQERAKQFMPFAALKGYEEALHRKEKIVVPKKELSEEQKQLLDEKFHLIRKNDVITVIYFHRGEYLQKTGMVSRLDPTARVLCVVHTRISFEDIYDVVFDIAEAGIAPFV